MTTFNNIRARIAAGGAVALAATAILAGPGQAGMPQSGDDGWLRALTARSEALNRAHAEPPWMRALRIRSEGLNRLYGLD
jgi:hypothetical protein